MLNRELAIGFLRLAASWCRRGYPQSSGESGRGPKAASPYFAILSLSRTTLLAGQEANRLWSSACCQRKLTQQLLEIHIMVPARLVERAPLLEEAWPY